METFTLKGDVKRLRIEVAAWRQQAINEGWSHNLAAAYGREEYARGREAELDALVAKRIANRLFAATPDTAPLSGEDAPAPVIAPGEEPFGYWVEQRHAEPALLRKPAYIPEPSDLRTVTPLFAQPCQTDETVERLREAATDAISWLKSAPLESGMCCCGSPVEGHGFGDGHSPVDDLAYSANQLQERLSSALATLADDGGAK